MTIHVVWSPETRRHEPMREVWVGVPTEGTEVPERVDRIRAALTGHDLVDATLHDDDVLLRVHDPAFVAHLRMIHAEWSRGPYGDLVGQDRVVPYVFPTPATRTRTPSGWSSATGSRTPACWPRSRRGSDRSVAEELAQQASRSLVT